MSERSLVEELLSRGLSAAFRLARAFGWRVFRAVFFKAAAWLLAALAPVLLPLLAVFLLFGFVYGAVFMLPKFIASSEAAPVIFRWGREDVWTPQKDRALFDAYKNLREKWLGRFRSFETLANQKPDFVRVSKGVTPKEKVSEVWGRYMTMWLMAPGGPGDVLEFDGLFADAGQAVGLDPMLLKAVAAAESGFDPRAVSPAGALGLMQLMPEKLQEYGVTDPFDPRQSVMAGARYLRYLLDRFGSAELALAAYNAGPGAVERFGGVPPYPETQSFVSRVLSYWQGGLASAEGMGAVLAGGNCFVVAERDQAAPHAPPWPVLASADRMLGDPIIHGKHGPETEPGRGRLPDPEKRFKEFEPELEWKDFELYYYHEFAAEGPDGGKVILTEEYRHHVKLLVSARTYEANFHYEWGVQEDRVGTPGEDYEVWRVPRLDGVSRSGPYFEKLANLLASYGLPNRKDVEFCMRLAMNLDESFYVDASLMSTLADYLNPTEFPSWSGPLPSGWFWPADGPVVSGYGMRVHPVTKQVRFHTGIDIAVPDGAPVRAAAPGLVVFVGWNSGYGKCVIVDHGAYRTLYGHLKDWTARPGEEVAGGQVIGLADSTGVSTGPHLHFEVRAGQGFTRFLDPLSVLGRR